MKSKLWVLGIGMTAVCLMLAGCPSKTSTVPNVVGQLQEVAGTAITAAGLAVGTITQEFSTTVASGVVISQSPAAGVSVSPGAVVALTVSKGGEPATVPDVVGQTQAAAIAVLTGAGFTIGEVTQGFSETVAVGLVISQSPGAGASAGTGSSVALTVSKGPSPVNMPYVVHQTLEAATATLTAAGLVVGTVTQEYSSSVASGSVISQAVIAGTPLSPGSAVPLTVSKGPQSVTVPNVVGLTQAAAGTALVVGANLTLGAITQEFSITVASGVVISQSPEAGASVDIYSAVALTVSKGPQPVNVPNLTGQTQAAASAALTAAQLVAGAVSQECHDTLPVGAVMSQHPAAGETVDAGSAVTLKVSTGPCAGSNQTFMLSGGVPLEMLWIQAGSFTMGSPDAELGHYKDESPQHSVTLDGFLMGKYELTKRQWQAVMGTTPWAGQDQIITDPDSPAVYISWYDAQSFLTALNAYTGKTFRLPSEAQWEYACRAGGADRFYWGDDPASSIIDSYAWWRGNAYSAEQQYAHVVGGKTANFFGLYDMSGNALEWCQDSYHDNYTGAPTDGSAWVTPEVEYQVLRGGDWYNYGASARSACRVSRMPYDAISTFGFRLAK